MKYTLIAKTTHGSNGDFKEENFILGDVSLDESEHVIELLRKEMGLPTLELSDYGRAFSEKERYVGHSIEKVSGMPWEEDYELETIYSIQFQSCLVIHGRLYLLCTFDL